MANYLPERRSELLFDWLRTVGPDDWHRMATQWNWDLGEDPLRWIIQQRDCDKATALHIFWHGSPEYYYASGATSREGLQEHLNFIEYDNYDLIVDIVSRWKSGIYTRSELQYPSEQFDWNNYNFKAYERMADKSYLHPPLAIPQDMARRIPGRKLDRGDFEEGIPTFICEATRDEPYDRFG